MAKHRPSLNSNDKTGFLRAVTDEWRDLSIEYGIALEFLIEPAGRAGVLRLTVEALDPDVGIAGLRKAYYQCEYPTAAVESLEACLFRCMVRLERLLRDARAHPMGKA